MLDVSVTSNVPNFTICEWDVTIPGLDLAFDLLTDPHEWEPPRRQYRFANGLTLDRDVVLNHRIHASGRLARGAVLNGLLLGETSWSIPESYRQGASVIARLSAIDHLGEPHTSQIPVWMDRSARTLGKSARRGVGEGLFGPRRGGVRVSSIDDNNTERDAGAVIREKAEDLGKEQKRVAP